MSSISLMGGRVLVVIGIGLIFVAYSNFIPTAFASERIADYVKNHFVREIVFGIWLAGWAIRLATGPIDRSRFLLLAMTGSIVVLPFWIAWALGWSVGGMSDVWGETIEPGAAYLLHGSQIAAFYLGLVLIWVGRESEEG